MKQSKNRLIIFMVFFWVTGCTSLTEVAVTETNTNFEKEVSAHLETTRNSTLETDYDNALPYSSQLIIGILKLADSDYPLDFEQAENLRLLWKAALSLSENETAATAETEAILTQIEDTLTTDQVKTINEMRLTMDDMVSMMEKFDINFGEGGFGREGFKPEMQVTMEAARESGQAMQGAGGFGEPPGSRGFGGGPVGGFGGDGISPEVQETARTERGERVSGATFMNPMLINVMIEYLEGLTPQ